MSTDGPPGIGELAAALSRLGPAGRVTLACYLVIGLAVVVEVVADAADQDRPGGEPSGGEPSGGEPSGRGRAGRARVGRERAVSLVVTISIALALAVPFAAALGVVWRLVAGLAPPPLTQLWTAHPVLGFIVCFVVVDAVAYLYHWVGHRTRVGWASHRVHHLGESFDMTLVLRQPWFPVHGLVIVPLTALGGFSFELAAACSMLSLAYQALQHTSRSWGLGRFEAVLMSGRAHRRHHLVDGRAANLGAVLTLWDRAAGTWQPDTLVVGARYGTGSPEPVNPLAAQLEGWRRVVDRTSPPPRTPASGPEPIPTRRSGLVRR